MTDYTTSGESVSESVTSATEKSYVWYLLGFAIVVLILTQFLQSC